MNPVHKSKKKCPCAGFIFSIIITIFFLSCIRAEPPILSESESQSEPKFDEFDTVAWVYDEPVFIGELRFEIAKNYSAILSRAVTAGGIQGKDFWETEIKSIGQTPLEMLKTAALQSSVRRKIIMIWARDAGFAGNISWAAFLESFENENLRRRAALDAGDPVYGPEQFSQRVFYDLVLSETEHKLKEVLQPGFVFDEKLLLHLYETEYRQLTYHPGVSTVEYVTIQLDRTDSRNAAQMIRQAAAAGKELKEAAQEYEVNYLIRTINLLRLPGMGFSPLLQQTIVSLKPGEVSQVLQQGEVLWIFKCIEREDEKFSPYESVKQVIIFHLMEDEYNKQLDSRVEGALKINPDVYDKIDKNFILNNNIGSR